MKYSNSIYWTGMNAAIAADASSFIQLPCSCNPADSYCICRTYYLHFLHNLHFLPLAFTPPLTETFVSVLARDSKLSPPAPYPCLPLIF